MNIKFTARKLKEEYENSNSIQEIVAESSEFYRAMIWECMQSLDYMNEAHLDEFDGSVLYTELVDELEGLFT